MKKGDVSTNTQSKGNRATNPQTRVSQGSKVSSQKKSKEVRRQKLQIRGRVTKDVQVQTETNIENVSNDVQAPTETNDAKKIFSVEKSTIAEKSSSTAAKMTSGGVRGKGKEHVTVKYMGSKVFIPREKLPLVPEDRKSVV